ncbi:ABC transporter [Bifidobacterium avesanii]|uniref:ABC transporter n=1 Tax=Bifidobacterium avesanii TaxID=1798157 RepID=A0A7K3THB4_9BIFI|nr:ABC transporter [Bifidobacterium avesanii]KAB8292684.1 ABC-2 type transporter [Bifidobacterium avesanii]NEG78488.1 ABC transporter [Bifidobacterium avesanii]
MTVWDDALDLLADVWFHMRALWATPFFLQTALLTPFTFSMFRLIASRWRVAPDLWFDASASGLWATTTTAVGIIGYQRFQGVLQYQAMGVKPAWAVFLPPVAASALIGVAGVPVAWATASLFAGRAMMPEAAQLAGLALAALACVASAAALSALFVLSRRAIAFEPLVLTPVWLLSGIVLPVDRFPAVARAIAFVHPLTAAVWVADRPRIDGPAAAAALWCLLLCMALLGCAGAGLRRALGRAAVDGTLDLA